MNGVIFPMETVQAVICICLTRIIHTTRIECV